MKKKMMDESTGAKAGIAVFEKEYLIDKAMAHCREKNLPKPEERDEKPYPINHPMRHLHPPMNGGLK